MLSLETKKHLEEIYQRFLHDEKILQMKDIYIHNGTSCYLHSFRVAKLAIKIAIKKGVTDNLETLLLAAILHDYYLYKRKIIKKRNHGSEHPFIASANAKRDFGISDEVATIINSHMWPINIKLFPKSKEAKILTLADKHVAIREFLTAKSIKLKNLDKDYQSISTLF